MKNASRKWQENNPIALQYVVAETERLLQAGEALPDVIEALATARPGLWSEPRPIAAWEWRQRKNAPTPVYGREGSVRQGASYAPPTAGIQPSMTGSG